jgi:hypothetical protein
MRRLFRLGRIDQTAFLWPSFRPHNSKSVKNRKPPTFKLTDNRNYVCFQVLRVSLPFSLSDVSL